MTCHAKTFSFPLLCAFPFIYTKQNKKFSLKIHQKAKKNCSKETKERYLQKYLLSRVVSGVVLCFKKSFILFGEYFFLCLAFLTSRIAHERPKRVERGEENNLQVFFRFDVLRWRHSKHKQRAKWRMQFRCVFSSFSPARRQCCLRCLREKNTPNKHRVRPRDCRRMRISPMFFPHFPLFVSPRQHFNESEKHFPRCQFSFCFWKFHIASVVVELSRLKFRVDLKSNTELIFSPHLSDQLVVGLLMSH